MKRKEILVYQLREMRNEFADALDGLTEEQLAATPIEGENPIGWLACHCLRNVDHFIHQRQLGKTLLSPDGGCGAWATYASSMPGNGNPPPDFIGLAEALDEVVAICAGLIDCLDEQALDLPAPYGHHRAFESTAGNCIRVINHSNAHLRQIWMLLGAMGALDRWPVQTLYKLSDEDRGRFYVPNRKTILADRATRRRG